MRWLVVMFVVGASARVAHADAWYFDWHCQSTSQGDCSHGASGTEGPFGTQSDCDWAEMRMLERINGPENAGYTNGCHDYGAAGGVTTGATARPARVDRFFLAALGGTGYRAAYTNGRAARATAQLGGQLEIAFGRPQFGLSVFAGAQRDGGTSPDPATIEATEMWMFEWGLGLVASPFAIIDRPKLEIRPELGVYFVELDRIGCERCDTDGPLGTQMPAEPSSGFGARFRAGVDIYFGVGRRQGVALDALIQLARLGDATDPLSSAVLTPPRLMFRLAFVSRRY